MKRAYRWAALFLLGASLASCSLLGPVASPAPEVKPADLGFATFAVQTGPAFDTFTFSAGEKDVTEARVSFEGDPLRLNAAGACKLASNGVLCSLGPLLAGQSYNFYASGAKHSSVTYTRPDGTSYTLTVR